MYFGLDNLIYIAGIIETAYVTPVFLQSRFSGFFIKDAPFHMVLS